LSNRTRDRILSQSEKNGDGRIELGMAVSLLERAAETPNEEDMAQAKSLLERVKSSDHLAVRTSALNLLRLMDPPETDSN
jgi:hypothetical protein